MEKQKQAPAEALEKAVKRNLALIKYVAQLKQEKAHLLDACQSMIQDIADGSCLNGSEASCVAARAAIAKATN